MGNMGQRPSMADDGYFTADFFSSPLDVLSDWKDSIVRAVGNPLETGFPTISNDQSGNRAYPDGGEVLARTIKPKEKIRNRGSLASRATTFSAHQAASSPS